MRKDAEKAGMRGFSLIELIISLVITLIILGIAVATFSAALGTRQRESSNTDAITSAQAALNIMSREIGNSGYGLSSNGIVTGTAGDGNPESGADRLHFRTNINNYNGATSDPGEDITYYFDSDSQSVVRYDAHTGQTSGIINRVSQVNFGYFQYAADGTHNTTATTTPTADTAIVRVTLTVILADVVGQPTNRTIKVESDITLRNSTYILGRY